VSNQPEPQTIINEKDGTELRRIPAGPFLMGDDKREVYVGEFWIGTFPVTVAQYRAFCEATSHEIPTTPWWDWADQHPMVGASWYDAGAYCRWAGLRLPTEQEWEKAARGVDGREYPWGNKKPTEELCNFGKEVYVGRPTDVGRYPQGASPYGCLDMVGNVEEWTATTAVWGSEMLSATELPAEVVHGRVLRGGAFYSSIWDVRCVSRSELHPEWESSKNGFRLCASPSQVSAPWSRRHARRARTRLLATRPLSAPRAAGVSWGEGLSPTSPAR